MENDQPPVAIELGWRQQGLGKVLSNLYPHPFTLDGHRCESMEGFLQSLKFEDAQAAGLIRSLSGFPAYRDGQAGNDWKTEQMLFWNGSRLYRGGHWYKDLLERAYDAWFEQNELVRSTLVQTGQLLLAHTIGKTDQRDTTLTAYEYLANLYRLRCRAICEKS